MKQKIHQVNAGENEQRIEIYKCIQNQRLTEIRSSHFPEVQLLRLRATFHALPLFYLRTYARKN